MLKSGKWRKARIGCLTVVGLFVVLIVVGVVRGGGSSSKKHSAKATGHNTDAAPARTKSSSSSTTTTHKAAPAPVKTHRGSRFTKYAGLGATVADFRHDNNMFCPNCALQPGEAAYTIKGVRDGRVTEYDVNEAFKPAASNETRLSLVEGTMIPGPITEPVRQTPTCDDYHVPQLKKLIGVEYAEASTYPGVTFATMQAVADPGC
jgi:hypothetical protein